MANPNDSILPLVREVVRVLDEKKAVDLQVLRVTSQSSITDFLVLATGTSEPHLRALRVELEKVLDGRKAPIAGMDTGESGSGWTVVDAYQVMVHLFTAEKREEYRLENLWKDAEAISVAQLLNPEMEVKPVKPVKPVRAKSPRKTSVAKKKPAAAKKAPVRKPAAKTAAKKKPTRKKTK